MPNKAFRYGICLGPWGDVICALGHFREVLGHGECIYYGYLDNSVVDFLKSQPYISNAHHLRPENSEDYHQHVRLMWSAEETKRREGIDLALFGSNFDSSIVADTNLNYGFSGYDAPSIPLASTLAVPNACRLWAQDVAAYLPESFFLLQPFSINTNAIMHHWPHWSEYARWLIHDQSKHFVTCGVHWDDSVFKKFSNVTRLVGKTPTVMHMYALADLAAGVITTSNSLAHYCAANTLRCIVLAAERNSEPTEYFRHVLKGDNLKFFNKFSSYFRVCYETREFMDIWPAVEISTS